MILPKSGCKSEVYLQVQNHLRIQNRQLISQLCKEAGISSTEIVDKRSKSEKDISKKVSKKVKKHFEDASTNTNDASSSDDGYR